MVPFLKTFSGTGRHSYGTMQIGLRYFGRVACLISSIHMTAESLSNICRDGGVEEAIQAVKIMHEQDIPLSRDNSYHLLQKCEKGKNLKCGRQVQRLMMYNGLDTVAVLGDHLVRLFTCHERLVEANQVFEQIETPSMYSWTAIILANAKLGQGQNAIELSHVMQASGMKTNNYIHVAVLPACALTMNLYHGRNIHLLILQNDQQLDVVLGTIMLDMYAKCGSLKEAFEFFDKLKGKNVVSWNAMISGCVHQGENILALHCYQQMLQESIQPNEITFLSTLKACTSIGSKEHGNLLHDKIIESRLQSDASVGSTLMNMYIKWGDLQTACDIFYTLQYQSLVSWNALINGLVIHGHGDIALKCFERLQQEGIGLDEVTLLSTLKACTAVTIGRLIHDIIIRSRFCLSIVMGNTLTDMYMRCGTLKDAYRVFNCLHSRDEVSWNIMLAGYIQNSENLICLEYYEKMQHEGVNSSSITYLSVVRACDGLGLLGKGRFIHQSILEHKLQSELMLGTALITMYLKCGSLKEGESVFWRLPNRDVVTWGAIIAGYVQHHQYPLALEYFGKMRENGIQPTEPVFVSALKAYAGIGSLEQARHIHEKIIQNALQSNITIGSTLIDMYANCDSLEEAATIFAKLSNRNVVSWNTMIEGYCKHGEGRLALECFKEMQNEGIKLTEVTILNVLKSCATVGSINMGRATHENIISNGFEADDVLGTSLVYMYAKCGNIEEACKVFNQLQTKDLVSWNAIITGCAQHGEGYLGICCFEKMQQEGIKPDELSFTGVLIVCSRMGLIDEGHLYFNSMINHHGIKPTVFHFSCMADLMARAGSLSEAQDLVETLTQNDTVGWISLLSATRTHGTV